MNFGQWTFGLVYVMSEFCLFVDWKEQNCGFFKFMVNNEEEGRMFVTRFSFFFYHRHLYFYISIRRCITY